MTNAAQIPLQTLMIPTIESLPVEIIQWGMPEDHYKIDTPHRHKFDELLFFKNGGGKHEIDFKQNEIRDCSVHFVGAGKVHFLQRGKLSSGFTIAFDSEFFETNRDNRVFMPIEQACRESGCVVNLNEHQFGELEEITSLLSKQIREAREYFRNKCFLSGFEMLVNKVASHFSKRQVLTMNSELSAKEKLLASFLNLVNQNALQQHNISWYASTLNVSTNYLGKTCQELEGLSPKALLNQYLLTEAKKLLCNTNHSCKELAYELGFKSGSQFSSFFELHTGFFPSAYKENA